MDTNSIMTRIASPNKLPTLPIGGTLIATGRRVLFGALLLLSVMIPIHTQGAGVTFITHGYAGNVTGWVNSMAEEIPSYYHNRYQGLSTNCTIYTLSVTQNKAGSFMFSFATNGVSPIANNSGEIVVKLDWNQLAGGLVAPYNVSTYDVAWAFCQVLLLTNTFPALNGRPLVEFPIHLIGHSRGGSLMSEISRQLGTNGLWIDHLTTLDPHPLNNDGNNDFPITVLDAPVRTYSNVLFHDNYWQSLGDGALVPDGEAVSGAYVRQLYSLMGGYPSAFLDFINLYGYHSNVHLWYHGTIDLSTPASYNEGTSVTTIDGTTRANWWVGYEARGLIAGFYYSLIGGGDRTSSARPLGLAGDPAIRDGYNQNWDLGAGNSNANRTALPSNTGTWPNIIKLNLTGTNVVTPGNLATVKFYYQYAGKSNATVQIYYDRDFNPYNSNSTSVLQGNVANTGIGNVYYYSGLGLTTTNVTPGVYSIYAKITDGNHTRYLYAPELLNIVSIRQPPILEIAKLNSTQFRITVNGLPSQTIALQTSSNMQTWLALATNTLAANRWDYTNNAPPNFSQQFFRALVLP